MAQEKNDTRKDAQHGGSDHILSNVPAGNAQLDPSEQSHRLDMEGDEHNGEGAPLRGSAPAGSDPRNLAGKTPAVPMQQKDLKAAGRTARDDA